MSIENLHEAFVERNGGIEVFRWIIEQDGVANYNSVKIYPIIAWNEFHHDGVIVIGSAYRHGEYFMVISHEEDYNYFPERLRVWIEDAMDLNEYSNIIEVFRDNHLIAICDESMEMMVKWYGEDIGIENIINVTPSNNNILFEDEVEMNGAIIQNDDKEDYLTEDTIKNISNMLTEIINTYNPNLNEEENLKMLEERYNNNNNNNNNNNKKIINNSYYRPETHNPYNFFKDGDGSALYSSNGFDEDFKEKWT